MSLDTVPHTPQSEPELLHNAHRLAGHTLGALAAHYGVALPTNLRRAKGWVGQTIEQVLGATAGVRALPDFHTLHVELKTLPLNRHGHPKETTYVCTVPLQDQATLNWESSWVRKKLQRVLWIPFEAADEIPLPERRIGNPILWSPTQEDLAILKQDWDELMELIGTGRIDQLSAQLGTYLQIRPKAANSRALCVTLDAHGELTRTLPRGFYLRTQFTSKILRDYYARRCG